MTPPPLEYVPAFVADPQPLLQTLCDSVDWDRRLRARLTASFGRAYGYSGIDYPDVPLPPRLADLAARLAQRLGFLPDNCLLNYYPNGAASMGFHYDDTALLAPDSGIAVLSLGAVRTLRFRPRHQRGAAGPDFPCRLENGSLLFMSAALQADWLHGLPAEADCGPRLSLTFRKLVEAA
ncbi:alpha-ketoglutarate-dependent dioxygenase AlkB family protein [Chitinimonas lacunae]|uniref:Alpha-ketoglutarate-dependent dioxygenase AlkB family protein n=1 Tax=Chitinimonas lacunae TaxID=1963018 RepID=A0ABV8MT78_9NEIS